MEDFNMKLYELLLEETGFVDSLFHGSTKPGIKEFTVSERSSLRGKGIFFSDSWKYAKKFGNVIYTCKVSLMNPIFYETSRDFETASMKHDSDVDLLYEDLKQQGHDGIIIARSKVSTGFIKEVICFQPTNIKILDETML
jgi:hypothetical protein